MAAPPPSRCALPPSWRPNRRPGLTSECSGPGELAKNRAQQLAHWFIRGHTFEDHIVGSRLDVELGCSYFGRRSHRASEQRERDRKRLPQERTCRFELLDPKIGAVHDGARAPQLERRSGRRWCHGGSLDDVLPAA